jgi:hypothetical protein
MTFHAQAIPFRRQRTGWTYRTTRDGVEERFTISVVLYPDGEILADAIPAGEHVGTSTFRATAMRRADANGKVHYVLVWGGREIASRARLTDLLEISGNQSIAMARMASDERYIKARAAAQCVECENIKVKHGGFGPPHNQRPGCQSGKGTTHCSCSVCF